MINKNLFTNKVNEKISGTINNEISDIVWARQVWDNVRRPVSRAVIKVGNAINNNTLNLSHV